MAAPTLGPSETIRILLLEDNTSDAELCIRCLKRSELKIGVDHVTSSGGFMERVRTQSYDLVLTDYRLSNWTGLDALHSLRSLGRDTPVILVTGTLGDERAIECIKAGVSDYVLKENLGRLPVAVRRTLAEHEVRQSRDRVKRELSESEKQYRLLFNANPHPMWVFDRETLRFLTVNDAAIEHYGYSLSEFLSMTLADIRPPEEMKRFLALNPHHKTAAKRELWKHRKKDGTIIDVEVSTQAITFRAVEAFLVLAHDVTEKRRADEELRMSEARLNEAQRIAQIGSWHYRSDGQIYWSDEMYELHKLSRDVPVTDEAIISAMHPDDREGSRRTYEKALASDILDFQSEYRVVWRDGQIRNLFSLGKIHRDGEGRVIEVAGTVQDVTARKQSDERLRQYEKALEGIEEMIVLIDRNYCYVIANRAFLKYRGLESEQVIGRHIAEVLDEQFFENPIKEKLDECFLGKVVRYEMKYSYPELGERNLSVSYFPIEEQGAVNCVACVLQDITEAKRVEGRLREYERVVEGLEEMILVVDRQYRYILANRAFLNFRGMSAEQIVGHSADEVVGQDVFLSQVKAKMDECFQGKVVQYEMSYNFPNLGSRDLNVSYFPIEGVSGVDRIACVLQDITEQKLAATELIKSEERFGKAFRNNPLAVTISAEADGRYLDVNDAFLNLLGYKRQEVIGRTSAELRFWKEPLDRLEMFQQLKEKGKLTKRHTQYRTASGEIREAEISAESIELDGQRCLLAITRDVTEIQQLEAQFRQAQKMEAVGRLAGGIAHDFNNILGIVMGYTDISLGLIEPGTPVKKYLNEIKKASQRAALLTRQLLAFSRKQVVFPKILDLNDLVHNAISMFMRLVGEDVEIEFRPSKSMVTIKADPGQTEQVLMNLVVNARDAMPHGGKILIETGRAELDEHYVSLHPGAHRGQHAVLLVSDTGCGMDEDTKSRIFEPFFTTKGLGHGTGLGLSTVYGIVKQSDGYVLVYSELDKGTTFKIYFPIVRGQSEELVAPHEEAEPPVGSETILVVEDDTTLRRLAAKLLQDGGYRVLEAKDADDALGIIANSEPEVHLLLTDVVLPGSNGAELAERAKASRPQLRSLFMSGYTGDLVGRQGVLMEQSHFLEKPFTKRSLLTKVYSVLHAGTEPSSPPESYDRDVDRRETY